MVLSEREQSDFNMSVSWLNRLNQLFYLCDEAALSLDAHAWLQSLSVIFRELSTEMKEIEIEEIIIEIEQINDIIQSELRNRNKIPGIPLAIQRRLQRLEMRLRRVLKESGLQIKMKQSAEFAINEM